MSDERRVSDVCENHEDCEKADREAWAAHSIATHRDGWLEWHHMGTIRCPPRPIEECLS